MTKTHEEYMMKSIGYRIALACSLTLGLGFGASASALDPDCVNVCQEILRDCMAQSVGSNGHCFRAYRECLNGCGY
jgi:hypothetical protein